MKPIELLDEICRVCGRIYNDFNEDNGFEWAEDFIDSLSCKVTISMGATKLVLIPEKENFVLKIPFFGRYCEVWKEN